MSDYKEKQQELRKLAKRPISIDKAKNAHPSGLNREQRRKLSKTKRKK